VAGSASGILAKIARRLLAAMPRPPIGTGISYGPSAVAIMYWWSRVVANTSIYTIRDIITVPVAIACCGAAG